MSGEVGCQEIFSASYDLKKKVPIKRACDFCFAAQADKEPTLTLDQAGGLQKRHLNPVRSRGVNAAVVEVVPV